MTSELPQQLRELADSLDSCQGNHPITAVRTCVEAAQEIERLRSELEVVREVVKAHARLLVKWAND